MENKEMKEETKLVEEKESNINEEKNMVEENELTIEEEKERITAILKKALDTNVSRIIKREAKKNLKKIVK